MKFTIKEASIDDAINPLFDLEQNIFTQHYHLRSPSKKFFLDWLKKSKIYAVYAKNMMIGYGAYERKDTGAEITILAVLKHYRNKKVGSLIMNKILSDLKDMSVEVKTHPENPAVNFYQKFGFIKGKIIDNYLGLGQPRLTLTRNPL